ncbi:MAG: transcription elongation factor GreA [Candidatus Borkfalkiaceae bacterium]|nr:transcription elongation factor GreA [Christensenellaceae bacterium]
MSEKVILTEEGKQELEKKLEYLKMVKRPEITERIKIAREFGDLSENAEYDAAKNEQALIEGEIIEIEAKLKVAEVITVNVKKDTVGVGAKVKFTDRRNGKVYEFEIVGTTEADFKAGRISNESPIGKALIGKKVSEIVTVEAPASSYEVQIEKVTY